MKYKDTDPKRWKLNSKGILTYPYRDKNGAWQYKKLCKCDTLIAYRSKRCKKCQARAVTALNTAKRKAKAGLC